MSDLDVLKQTLPISVRAYGGKPAAIVDARHLHKNLGVKTSFTMWIKRRLSAALLKENSDYYEVFTKDGKNLKGGRPKRDYYLTLEAAKHIAMLEKTDLGYEIRQYFISFEAAKMNRLRELVAERVDPNKLDRKQILIMALEAENERIALEQQNKMLEQEVFENAPKVAAYEAFMSADGNFTVSNAAKIIGDGPKKLWQKLRDEKLVFKMGNHNLPYQRYLDRGLFEVKAAKAGKYRKPQTVVTPKGLEFLKEKFGGN